MLDWEIFVLTMRLFYECDEKEILLALTLVFSMTIPWEPEDHTTVKGNDLEPTKVRFHPQSF